MFEDEQDIQLRVVRWLEGVGRKWSRLRELADAEQALDEGADGVKAANFEARGRSTSHADPVSDLVIMREERRGSIACEREAIRQEIHAASAVINRAWTRNPGRYDRDFAYLQARYGEGMSKADASRAAGLTAFAAIGCARKVAAFVYEADPSRFGRRAGRVEYGGMYAGLRAEDNDIHDAAEAAADRTYTA